MKSFGTFASCTHDGHVYYTRVRKITYTMNKTVYRIPKPTVYNMLELVTRLGTSKRRVGRRVIIKYNSYTIFLS